MREGVIVMIMGVVYQQIDGAHVFTSDHPLLDGLYAGSMSLEEAYEDMLYQAKTLLELNHGMIVDVRHEVPLKQFIDQI